ncbi:MAG: hypothetical protein FWH43_06850 [Endomicrobia bacterium]|nr:hypothetical protein [Endomicrobiia bacterium]
MDIKILLRVCLLPALLAAMLLNACTGGGGNRPKNNTNVRSVDIVCEDMENVEMAMINKKERYIFPEFADFRAVLIDVSNNEIFVNDTQNIVWTLEGADENCYYFLYSSSLSASTGTAVTVCFSFEPPYDTEADIKISYAGLSKTVKLAAYD